MLNPISYTEKITRDFLRYQSTTYRFSDPHLDQQMRHLLSLQNTRDTPLLKGPYVSLSRLFQRGSTVDQLRDEGILHPELADRIPFERVYAHQDRAIRGITDGQPTLVSTGTGSGKTEAFLYPIISRCLELQQQNRPPGIEAVLIYPMNALAQDQLERIRELLAGTGISFGLYVGKTPQSIEGAEGTRLEPGATHSDYLARKAETDEDTTIYPSEEKISRNEMRTAGDQPRILLTNVKQLELLLTRQRDADLFADATLGHLVLDEAHTFRGATGAETASLIRRLRRYCGNTPDDTTCIATSATIADPDEGEDDAAEFMSRLFGVDGSDVCFVSEEYADQTWSDDLERPGSVESDAPSLLENVLKYLRQLDDSVQTEPDRTPPDRGHQDDPFTELNSLLRAMTGRSLDRATWRADLYDILSSNKFVYQIAEHLTSPKALDQLAADLSDQVADTVEPAEILMWMALGAAARKNDRPLLRPVVHSFIRGVDGAVVTFPSHDRYGSDDPRLWLSGADAAEEDESLHRFQVTTCTTCGQHYYPHQVAGFDFTNAEPGGGQMIGHRRVWHHDQDVEQSRAILIDSLAFAQAGDMENDPTAVSDKIDDVYVCRSCGSMHSMRADGCAECGTDAPLIEMFAVQQKEERPDKLTTCVACNSHGRKMQGDYREPIRPVRAVNVSDVHVIAQSMLHHAERERLLVFTDNRQDAAFQAGWMRDHARRFRLRSLMYDHIDDERGTSVGDLTFKLDNQLADNDDLSRTLAREVWQEIPRSHAGQQHRAERKKFLRIQILRELTNSVRQKLGLESWGRIRIDYPPLEGHDFFTEWADRVDCSASELYEGVATWLDVTRRGNILHDSETSLFASQLNDQTSIVQNGYIPELRRIPTGLKLTRGANDDDNRVRQVLSATGHTTLPSELARKWGMKGEHISDFWNELWDVLTEEIDLLEKVTLTWNSGDPIAGAHDVYQIDSDKLLIQKHSDLFRCPKCRRAYPRRTPQMVCPGWQCDGHLEHDPEDEDDYNLMVLDERFSMVRPREHSGQVPNDERSRLERSFKGDTNSINTLVCTPTLELGVDIGALDSVLMRNVPPLPSNYWQRVGRAGRRHRMAVNITYARPVSHDRAYFDDPLKMLDGKIEPPSFNLRNQVLVSKHVHATVISYLYRQARRDDALGEDESDRIRQILGRSFPRQVRNYLFEEASGQIRNEPFDLSPLSQLIRDYRDELVDHVEQAFQQHWPHKARSVVSTEAIQSYIDDMTARLREVIDRLDQRLQWAHNQIQRINRKQQNSPTLKPSEQRLRRQCEKQVNRLKGISNDDDDFHETYTYSVLATEGFLPGYGLDTGGILGTFQGSISGGANDMQVRRTHSQAVREFVPGNLVYANGNRYTPKHFELKPADATSFSVDVSNEAVVEQDDIDARLQRMCDQAVDAVPVCDVTLPRSSTISDDETFRFRMPSAVYGYELDSHGGGERYEWGGRTLTRRDGVDLRLVNVGPSRLVDNGKLGYPVCQVCGGSRSPFSTDNELERFREFHQSRCDHSPSRIGFYANISADTLALPGCDDAEEGYSVAEALRHGAARVLEMELEDLEILAIGRPGQDAVDMALYDPMPGGSGLLDQMLERWPDIVSAALDVVEHCPSACDTVCVDCLMTFRNMFYHNELDRHVAADRLRRWSDALRQVDTIAPEVSGDTADDQATSSPTDRLASIFHNLDFPTPDTDHTIDTGTDGITKPDFAFTTDNPDSPDIALYLGDADTEDEQVRRWQLDTLGYSTIEIPLPATRSPDTLQPHLTKLAYKLNHPNLTGQLSDSTDWFE